MEIYFGDYRRTYETMCLSTVKLIAKAVNCWKTLTLRARAISRQAQKAIFGKLQRLELNPYGMIIAPRVPSFH